MDRWAYYAITHRDHRILNPLSSAKLDELVALLRLGPGTRLLDIACGKGELLLRAAATHDVRAVGVDKSPPWVRELREEVARRGLESRIEVVESDGADHDAPAEHFDIVSCIGASWIWGGCAGTLRALHGWARPGGLVVAGEPYLRCEPAPGYLASGHLQGMTFASHEGNVAIGLDLGLVPLYALTASPDDWDRYEGLQWQAAERWAADNPDHPVRDEVLGPVRRSREVFLRWGRETLGFGVYLFRKPS